jgi:hypothetical protein
MKPNRFLTIFSYILLATLLALTPILTPRSVTAAEIQHESIVGNVVWSSSRGIGTDTVVENGATLTIKSGVTIGIESTGVDPSPYPGGRSDKVEIIVENGGTLIIEPGVTITAGAPGNWYGVVFLAGSSGTIDSATIRNGTVGITIRESSPTIKNSTISDMQGFDGNIFNSTGELAAGIYIIGPSASQVMSNTIENIVGGDGFNGPDGLDSSTPAGDGDNGGNGANGGPAFGIYIFGDAVPAIKDNFISEIYGGEGGDGGEGGNGAAGWPFFQNGGSGGNGGNGGLGGLAHGISVNGGGSSLAITNNTIQHINGGDSGYGGDGGNGGAGGEKDDAAGGVGGNGGDGGNSNVGGDAVGICASSDAFSIQNNRVYSIYGGYASTSGNGGNGGDGAAGYSASLGQTFSGGNGGDGGNGGNGSSGGIAVGIDLLWGGGLPLSADPRAAVPTMISGNIVADTVSSGMGGEGGNGGQGGAGGDGGDGNIGADAGHGGYGGTGGYGYNSGFAIGLWVEAQSLVHISHNRISEVEVHNAGDGGNGGSGGNGGKGGDGSIGVGGDGGKGGSGGHGGWGGTGNEVDGLLIDTPVKVQNNVVSIDSGNLGGDGGNGGAGGTGGEGGTGISAGSGAKGGNGGNGGDGNNYGPGEVVYVDGDQRVELVNNTLVDMHGESSVGEGGLAGSGGSGPGGTGNNGTPGSDGTDGDDSCGLCLDTDAQLFIINNIIYHTEISEPATPANSTAYGIYSDQPTTISLDYNNLYGWDQNYFDVSAGPHDSLLDPLFLDVDDDDYHLTSHSPCIDKGTSTFTGLTLPADDLDGVTRPQGSSHDMGAYESLSIRYIYLPLILR